MPLTRAFLSTDDLARDWKSMGWTSAGSGKFVCTSGSWALRAIIVPFGTLDRSEQAKRATDLDDLLATLHRATGKPPPRPEDEFAGLIDGTLCRSADGAPITWLDRERAGNALHEFLSAGYFGPTLRFRSVLPWERFVTHEGAVFWRRRTARGRRSAEVIVSLHDVPYSHLRPHWRATMGAAVFETTGQCYRFDSPCAAMAAVDTEVGGFR